MPNSTSINACRSCGSGALYLVADLGATPLANALLTREQLKSQELTFPLKVVFCHNCTLLQITETVQPDLLFGSYVYASSYSDTMLQHADELSRELCTKRHLGPASLVIEVASNDGYLLQYFVRKGIPVMGIEPAVNIAEIAQGRGIFTRIAFFGNELADQLVQENVLADVVIGNNVLAHVADINGFLGGVAKVLKGGGIARFEFPYVGDLIDNFEFDTIYHEHIFYFSAHAIEHLFRRHGLIFTDVEHLPIHGGSLAVTAALQEDGAGRERVEDLLRVERERGMDKLGFYVEFGSGIQETLRKLREMLLGLASDGKRVCAYGASAKGSTLLNVLNLEQGSLEYVVDRSPLKQGFFTPGTHLEIFPPERLLQDRPDYVLLLTWNFLDEILRQQRTFRESGGRFIVPIPSPRII